MTLFDWAVLMTYVVVVQFAAIYYLWTAYRKEKRRKESWRASACQRIRVRQF